MGYMRSTRSVTIVHPDVKVRITLRTLLEANGCTVTTDHGLRDLASTTGDFRPDIILVERSLLLEEGIDILSELQRKWDEAMIVYLPEELSADAGRAGLGAQLIGIIDRMLELKPTREILKV